MKKWGFALLLAISMLLALGVSVSAADVGDETALRTAIANGTDVKLTAEITLTAPLTVEKSLTLDLNGKKLIYTGTAGSIITVENATLIIADSAAEAGYGGMITSNDVATSENGGGLYIGNGGTVEMQAGSISNCAATKKGGGVYVAYGGTVELTGSEIRYCKSSGNYASGGGMYIEAGGIATMSGGLIVNCTAEGSGGEVYGGGVYVASPTSSLAPDLLNGYGFQMSGGSIKDCKAKNETGRAFGGGVYIDGNASGVFKMTGGRIASCSAVGADWAFGGGVYLNGYDGKFTMSDGTITNCTVQGTSISSDTYGGGVGVSSNGVFEMTDGSIAADCTSYSGNGVDNGGLYLWEATMQAHGGAVNCAVLNREGTIETGENPSGITTFYSTVTNEQGTISGGTFERAVDNGSNNTLGSEISGGTFNGSVINRKSSKISGGTFHGTVTNEAEYGPGARIGTISGGTFDETPYGAYLVTFDARGGQPVPASQVRVNAPASEPTPKLTKDDQYFLGWYTDIECTQPYDFTKKRENYIMKDTTLYALWEGDRCTMSFDSDGGSAVEPQMALIRGYTAIEPEDPTKTGATFLGWFTEDGKHWNFTHDRVTGNITLKARWSDGGTPTPPSTVAVTGVTLDKASMTLAKGGSETLTAAVAPGNATNKTVLWSSTDASVAAVSNGSVTAAKAGMALIIARTADGNHIAVCTVTVTEDTPVESRTVRFDANGGSGSMADVSVQKGSSYPLPACRFTAPDGMEFDAWQIGGARYGVGALYPVSADTTVMALWKSSAVAPGTCTIRFDANNGTGTMDPVSVQKGSSYPLPACRFTAPDGMEFDAWQIGGARYGAGALYPVSADTTVKALWRSSAVVPGTCTVRFDANGGTGAMDAVHVQTGSSFPLPICGFTAPAGKQFAGWARSADGAVLTGSIHITADMTLYAIWEEIPAAEFVIIFDANGGTATFGSLTTVGQRLPSLPGAVRSGYRFGGWFTAKAGGSRVTTDTVFSANTTVYAHWTYLSSGGNDGSTVTPPVTEDVPNQDRSFDDVPSGSYYEGAVSWAVENRITDGTDPARFSPDSVCTRAQAVTFLYRAAGSPAPASRAMPFADVPAGSYYQDAVLWAVETGITKGTRETAFSPDAPCTRAQIVSFLYRMIQSEGGGFTGLWMFRLPFTDTPDWAYEAIAWCYQKGITAGTTATTFSPDAGCTRAQIVTFLWRCKK